MTVEHGEDVGRDAVRPPRPDAAHLDAAHLDEDAEALEDPVHSGDAIHQHELHERHRPPAD